MISMRKIHATTKEQTHLYQMAVKPLEGETFRDGYGRVYTVRGISSSGTNVEVDYIGASIKNPIMKGRVGIPFLSFFTDFLNDELIPKPSPIKSTKSELATSTLEVRVDKSPSDSGSEARGYAGLSLYEVNRRIMAQGYPPIPDW